MEMDAVTAARIFQAYRTGLLRKPGQASGSRPSYPMLLSLAVRERFPLPQRAIFRRIERASWQGLCAAREGKLEQAGQCFELAQKELARSDIAMDGRLLGTSVLQAAQAYLDYREGRLEDARKRVLEAMDADRALGQDEAFSVLELHRIQTAHNLMRIDLRAGLTERALSLAGNIFGYLEGRIEGLPVHEGWRQKAMRRIPRIPRRMMIAQIANEVALLLAGSGEPEHWRALLGQAGPWLSSQFAAIHPGVVLWLRAKEALSRGDGACFLSSLSDFLPMGRDDIPAVWYSCVVELLDFCQARSSPLSCHIGEAILRDSAKWPIVPPIIRACLNRYSGNTAA